MSRAEGEVSEAAKARACELANAADMTANWRPDQLHGGRFIPGSMLALMHFIQEVSDAAKSSIDGLGEPRSYHEAHIGRFILPETLDPLTEALREAFGSAPPEFVEAARASLARRGIQIGSTHE